MPTKGYTVLGWIAWQIATKVAKRKMTHNKAKLGAVATVFALVAAALVAVKVTGED